MAVSTAAVGAIGAGALFAYAGLKGLSIPAAIQGIIQGKAPATAKKAAGIPLAADIANAAAAAQGSVTLGGGTGTSASGTAAAGSSAASYQAYAFSLFPSFGWGTDQQAPLVKLWNQESGWNPAAQNPTSTAYGIAQFLDSTWGPYGAKTPDASLQIKYGLEYIRDRYGSPAGAWAHEQANNWY